MKLDVNFTLRAHKPWEEALVPTERMDPEVGLEVLLKNITSFPAEIRTPYQSVGSLVTVQNILPCLP
jgi:hypothetical protein